jgi:hypothetical protein
MLFILVQRQFFCFLPTGLLEKSREVWVHPDNAIEVDAGAIAVEAKLFVRWMGVDLP